MYGQVERSFMQGDSSIKVSVGWDANEDHDKWELYGEVLVVLNGRVKHYELRHMEQFGVTDWYSSLQAQGFMDWTKRLPAPSQSVRWWNNRHPAIPETDTEIKRIASLVGLSSEQTETLRNIAAIIESAKTSGPKLSAREHYYGH